MVVDISLDQIRAFVGGVDQVGFSYLDRDGAYALISVTRERVIHPRLGNADSGMVLRVPEKGMGLSTQVNRLLRQDRRTG